jgi:hypothetical protein
VDEPVVELAQVGRCGGDTDRVRSRRLYILVGAIVLAVLAGWGIGSMRHKSCDYSCPAQGPCPEPADCLRHSFNWSGAVVVGIIVAVIATSIGGYIIRPRRP